MFLGIEIGGTKLQIGVGPGDGSLVDLWRGQVDPRQGASGIRNQILQAVPELLAHARIDPGSVQRIGVGFGGPVDGQTQRVIKSHQIEGWDDFPLAEWISDQLRVPTILGNDADLAGLAEASFGAGQQCSPLFYITIGSGIGGGLILDGRIYNGAGKGAAEIGHLQVLDWRGKKTLPVMASLESIASGWAIDKYARECLTSIEGQSSLITKFVNDVQQVTASQVAQAAMLGDSLARTLLLETWISLAEAICQVIVLLCPRRIVIGGGVSLMGDLLFLPLREMVAERVFPPFRGFTDIVPAMLGEMVVVHGALALAAGNP